MARYAQTIVVNDAYKSILRAKQGGSKARAKQKWTEAREYISPVIGEISSRDKLLILAALYWGEGTKAELNIINGDSELLRVFVECMEELGVPRNDLSFSLRVFGDMSVQAAKDFWARRLGITTSEIKSVEMVPGGKGGKLPNGMCRVRMRKGERHFKLIMSMIQLVSSRI